MAKNKLTLLREAVANLISAPLPTGETAIEKIIQDLGLFTGKIGSRGEVTGIKIEGALALAQLVRDLITENPQYRRGGSVDRMFRHITDYLLVNWLGRPARSICSNDLVELQSDVSEWFRSVSGMRRSYVPCAIIPDSAAPFAIGPVTFMRLEDLDERERGSGGERWELAKNTLLQSMRPRAASWVGVVEVSGADEVRSPEIADTAVDIAIAGLQCVVPPPAAYDASKMSRVTSRTLPSWRGNVSVVDQSWQIGMEHVAPGLGISRGTLETVITAGRQVLDAMGNRISAYVTGNYVLPQLEQAWCDGAFWFHEALSEPLDTVAVPKLGIAMEVLLRGGSAKVSKTRMVSAMRAFFNLGVNDLITPTAMISVRQFIDDVHEASARIRHGNWSTLMTNLYGNRNDLELFAKRMLISYAQHLNGFTADRNARDDIIAFLDWTAGLSLRCRRPTHRRGEPDG
jgi:hypothetical protein